MDRSLDHKTEEMWATAWLASVLHSVTETQNKILEKITKGKEINTQENSNKKIESKGQNYFKIKKIKQNQR